MKIFILVILAATLIGGFIGGELTEQTFTVWGAMLGGVGTFAILMGLGAYFSRQEERKRKDVNLTPEMRAVFDRMLARKQVEKQAHALTRSVKNSGLPPEIKIAIDGLIEEDAKMLARGEIPERRLIPHHAIKRDIILRAFEIDFNKLSPSMQNLNRDHYESQIAEIRQLGHDKLDEMIAIMKLERADVSDIEKYVRDKKKSYSIVDQIF